MPQLRVPHQVLDALTHAPVRFDALIGEDGAAYLFEKTVRMNDPGKGWRGHGVRITEARFSASVPVGETLFTRVEIVCARRLRGHVYAR
jgi:hypothetical protein